MVQGSNASFTVQVNNSSTGAATNVVVKDTLGAGMTFVSASGNPTITTAGSLTILTRTIGTVPGGASSPSLSLTVKTTSEGVLYNTACVTTTDVEPNKKSNVSRACVTVPIKLCTGDQYVASVPAEYTNVQWYTTDDNTISLVVAPSVTTTCSATCTLSTGCSSTTSATVTVIKAPSYTTPPMAITATCSGAVANSDARIELTTLQETERVGISLGSTYGSGPAYGAATNVTGGTGTFAGLPNPASKQAYTLRLFSAGGDQFVDVTVMLSPADCACPVPKCVPVVIQKI